MDGWKNIHKNARDDLAVCYNVSKVKIIEGIEPSVLEVFPIVLETEKEIMLLVMLYCMPVLFGSFIGDFISLINELPKQHNVDSWRY